MIDYDLDSETRLRLAQEREHRRKPWQGAMKVGAAIALLMTGTMLWLA